MKDQRKFLVIFDEKFGPKLLYRQETMRAAFSQLLSRKQSGFVIVETGCVSKYEGDGKDYGAPVPPDHPWFPGSWNGPWAAGMSTIIFDEFAQMHDGRVFSVDLTSAHVQIANSITSPRTNVACGDSVAFLYNLKAVVDPHDVDLLYLDSYDCDWNNPGPSSLHHLKELAAILGQLKTGCLILLDDCWDKTGRPGKGLYVSEFFSAIGCRPIVSAYQVLWQKC